MTTLEFETHSLPAHPMGILRRVAAPVASVRRSAASVVARVPRVARAVGTGARSSASTVASTVATHAPRAASAARAGVRTTASTVAATVATHTPQAASAAQAAVRNTTVALQQLPDSTLRSLAASSVGLGAGLYLSGKRRLAIVAGLVPALLAGVAITRPPVQPVAPAEPAS